MAKNARGVRDGSGPYKGSARGAVGKRKAAGKKCPAEKAKKRG